MGDDFSFLHCWGNMGQVTSLADAAACECARLWQRGQERCMCLFLPWAVGATGQCLLQAGLGQLSAVCLDLAGLRSWPGPLTTLASEAINWPPCSVHRSVLSSMRWQNSQRSPGS
uniref:Uncharacterized protein n=1 Tax=Cebus imitator TaxID=2715852 RepID=A0A2K5P979_CEBIM